MSYIVIRSFTPFSFCRFPTYISCMLEIYKNLKGVKDRITKYDMVDPFKILVMVDSDTENPELQWGDEITKRDILVHWLQVDLTEAIAYQRDTNQYVSEEDMTSSDWVKDLMVNSSEAELKQQVDKTFDKLESIEHDGITYLKFMLDEMFCMMNDLVDSLQEKTTNHHLG